MALFREIYVFPYSGWWEKPWSSDIEDAQSLDAAARSARRVTESVSWAFRPLRLEAPRAAYMLGLRVDDVEQVVVDVLKRPAGHVLGHLTVSREFHRISPDLRARELGRAATGAMSSLAAMCDWDPEIAQSTLGQVSANDFRAGFEGEWKTTRDRRRRVRLIGAIADDGYLRVAAEIDDGSPRPRRSEEIIGWTWLDNLHRAAKTMRFIDADTLWFNSGSMTDFEVPIDLSTGKATRTPPNPVPLSYPGA